MGVENRRGQNYLISVCCGGIILVNHKHHKEVCL